MPDETQRSVRTIDHGFVHMHTSDECFCGKPWPCEVVVVRWLLAEARWYAANERFYIREVAPDVDADPFPWEVARSA